MTFISYKGQMKFTNFKMTFSQEPFHTYALTLNFQSFQAFQGLKTGLFLLERPNLNSLFRALPVPALGFQIHGFQKHLSSTKKGEYDLKKGKNAKNFLFHISLRKKIYFKYLVLLYLPNNLFKIHGFRNPSVKFHGFQGTHGTHANAATEY